VVAGLGAVILHPGPVLQSGLLLVRGREESDAAKVIEVLSRSEAIATPR